MFVLRAVGDPRLGRSELFLLLHGGGGVGRCGLSLLLLVLLLVIVGDGQGVSIPVGYALVSRGGGIWLWGTSSGGRGVAARWWGLGGYAPVS